MMKLMMWVLKKLTLTELLLLLLLQPLLGWKRIRCTKGHGLLVKLLNSECRMFLLLLL